MRTGILLSLLIAGVCCGQAQREKILPLDGIWRIRLDRDDQGIDHKWYADDLKTADTLRLPGSLQEQGFGDVPGPSTPWVGQIQESEWSKPKYTLYRSVDNFKMPFWLQPERYYKGAAWYQKIVTIPRSWENRQIMLLLERPHWKTTVWIDSHIVDSMNHLSTPHYYELSDVLTPGDHRLTVCVDNREIVDVGVNSHSISDHTQSNWNGIVGKIQLQAELAAWIDDLQVYPDLENGSAKVHISVRNRTGNPLSAELQFDVSYQGRTVKSLTTHTEINAGGSKLEVVISLDGSIKTWDEFNPALYTLKTQLKTELGQNEHLTTFGMREVATKGNRLMLNGRRAFMRGTLECCIFPKTGYPPTDTDSWKRIINICKAHGLNHIRFHSWCPPEAAFMAADELGFYYQIECSSWSNYGGGQGIGNGKSIDRWLYEEADAILNAYGNHPSFLLFAYGNEPDGPENGAVYLRKWVSHYKQKDPRRLVTSGSGWPLIRQSDYHVTPSPRIQAWGQQLKSRINSMPPETLTDYRDIVKQYPDQPIIAHEIGQWCVYPDFDEINKYTGILKPKNFEIFRDFLDQKHMLDQARDFLMASGKLQTLCYKEDIESALRTPNFGGFQLLDLHDFPGQGTALVGVLDPFWDSKPYVSPADYRKFCAAIVPLVRLPKRIFISSDTLSAQVEVSHFGPTDLTDANIEWALLDSYGQSLRRGVFEKDKMSAGELCPIGVIDLPLSDFLVPAKYTLILKVKNTDAWNDWDIWIYPDTVNTQASNGVMITETLDDSSILNLQNGGKVLLALNPASVQTDIKLGFSSIFWNTAWTGGQAPHTLGILCDPKHPALADFPTESHSNWQWSEPIQHAAAMQMDPLPARLHPIVQVVPDWFEPKRLGLIFEAKVGKGALLLCSIDIRNNLENRPVERQLRASLLNYMHSDKFSPDTEIDIESLNALFHKPTLLERLNAKVIYTSSQQEGYEGYNAIDDNPETLWHTRWTPVPLPYPHEIQIELGEPVMISGFTCLPRQDGSCNGWIAGYELYVSDDVKNWGQPAAKGIFENNAKRKTVRFNFRRRGRFVRLVALNGFDNAPYASLAEIDLLLE